MIELDGVQRFAHVCIHDGGSVQTLGRLTLIARTIVVGAGSSIGADGVVIPTNGNGDGRYAHIEAGLTNRSVPHTGTPGAPGTPAGVCCGGTSTGRSGGAGGGSIALVAGEIVLAGSVTANGAAGAQGGDGFGTPSNCGSGGPGSGGGSGGGVYVSATTLQLSGQIEALGAPGGPGGHGDCDVTGVADGGAYGGPGIIKIFVATLGERAGSAPIIGPAVLGHSLPVDPVPPAPALAGQYFASAGHGPGAALIGHSLAGPFLAFWLRNGGVGTLGYPRTEPFRQDGALVQYTDHFLLDLDHGQVRVGALGRVLTQGRTFPRVAPVPDTATRRYFSATGHTLSGRYLAYWEQHGGATLLGRPISEVVVEGNGDGSGRRYPMQWFENGRLEYHPELAGTPYAMELGLVGVQALQRRGWLP